MIINIVAVVGYEPTFAAANIIHMYFKYREARII